METVARREIQWHLGWTTRSEGFQPHGGCRFNQRLRLRFLLLHHLTDLRHTLLNLNQIPSCIRTTGNMSLYQSAHGFACRKHAGDITLMGFRIGFPPQQKSVGVAHVQINLAACGTVGRTLYQRA